MLYAKVVVGLPVEGPFDYLIPQEMSTRIKTGSRVRVIFGYPKVIGYCVAITNKTGIKNIRPILELIDDNALLDANMLRLTRELSGYYCCSWGEAIEAALPQGLRQGKKIPPADGLAEDGDEDNREKNITLVHIPDAESRWGIYFEYIKKALERNKPVIVLLPDRQSLSDAKDRIYAQFGIMPLVLCRNQRGEAKTWCALRDNKARIVMGIRSAVFAPLKEPGLIIVDEEENFVYKQDQVPHYHAREAALMRAKIDQADVLLGSASPTLEVFYLARKNKINYMGTGPEFKFPEIKIVDTRNYRNFTKKKKIIFSKFMEDAIYSALNSKEKVLLFLNRKGFATLAACGNCGIVLKCPRCSINLVYHLKGGEALRCHYCNFKTQAPKICPSCNSGYIKYSGTGTEKLENELSALFPSAIIRRIEKGEVLNLSDADIFVATSAVTKQTGVKFGMIGVLSIDNSLNHADLRSSERTFAILVALMRLTDKRIVIQTAMPVHHCFQALLKGDLSLFYDEELKQRKELHFPPYTHQVLVKLRGKKEERVKKAAESLFEKLSKCKENRGTRILSVNPGSHPKLRDNFYWQVLLSCNNVPKAGRFLKINLKEFRHSGIIVTVDVDPI